MPKRLLVIHLPEELEPAERGEKYERPLDAALKKAGQLGRCVGGGTMMVTRPGFRIAGCDIEVEVRDLVKALPIIRTVLDERGVRAGATVTDPDTETTVLRRARSGWKANEPPPPPKRFVDDCPWETGTILGYRFTPRHRVLLEVVGFQGHWSIQGGQSKPPWFRVLDWVGKVLPATERIAELARQKPLRWRLKLPHEVLQQKPGERDPARFTHIGMCSRRTFKATFDEIQGWTWSQFDELLKQVFDLGHVPRRVRLNHDLGLVSEHLAFWDSSDEFDAATVDKVFQAYASRWWNRHHPGYMPFAATDSLRQFIRDLKAAIPEGHWAGQFSAREGFAIAPVADGVRRQVWNTACTLAKRYRIRCYDPQAERVFDGRSD